MFISVFRILAAAFAMGIALSPGAASAAMLHPAALAYSSSSAPPAGDPDTTVTFAVATGALSMTAPLTANLGSAPPGGIASGALGAVTVTDDRALLSASWTVTAEETDWTTGASSTPETIPAADGTYTPGSITTTGTVTSVTGTPITLSSTVAKTVVTGSGVGDNTASWNPTIAVTIPAAAVGGTYTGTLTQSVS